MEDPFRKILSVIWSILIIGLMVIPFTGGDIHWLGRLDLIVHFSLFAILGGLSRDLLNPSRNSLSSVNHASLLLIVMVLVPEITQGALSYRHFSLWDLTANFVGIIWGLLIGFYGPPLLYVLGSGTLLGTTLLFELFEDGLFNFLFADYGISILYLTVLLPLIPLLILVQRRSGLKLLFNGSLYVIFLLVVKASPMGMGLFLGSLSFTVLSLITITDLRIQSEDIDDLLILGSLSGLFLFILKARTETSVFVTQFGAGLVGVVTIASVIYLLLVRGINPLRLKLTFQETTDS